MLHSRPQVRGFQEAERKEDQRESEEAEGDIGTERRLMNKVQ
jgi:hypothetical protein